MATDREVATAEQPRSAPEVTSMAGVDAAAARDDRQNRLDKIEYLISSYRVRHMQYVWRDRMPEAEEVTRKIDRLLERWQRVHERDFAGHRQRAE